ncbi:MAG: hypothetical protein LIO94_04450 [Clostridiales bacterium]|nr:hypothetical protein [Clostridiales bacterium]
MKMFHNEREAYLFGQQQTSLIPEPFRRAFLQGVRDKAYRGKALQGGFLDPEVEGAYNKLLSAYKTKAAIARVLEMNPSNLHSYITGQASIGPRVKEKFLSAAAAVPAVGQGLPAAG